MKISYKIFWLYEKDMDLLIDWIPAEVYPRLRSGADMTY
jgi:hypothetical protein